MQQLVMVIHFFTCISLVVLVLIQHGKGADVGAAFGSGASTTLFGSQGSSSFLLKLTSLLAAVFFASSITLGYMASKHSRQQGGMVIPLSIPAQQQEPQQNFGLSDEESSKKSTGIESQDQNAIPATVPVDNAKKE